jgi:hypothetical protein
MFIQSVDLYSVCKYIQYFYLCKYPVVIFIKFLEYLAIAHSGLRMVCFKRMFETLVSRTERYGTERYRTQHS